MNQILEKLQIARSKANAKRKPIYQERIDNYFFGKGEFAEVPKQTKEKDVPCYILAGGK